MSGDTGGIIDGLGFFSVRGGTSIPDEDREDLLRSFHRNCRVKFHVLFTAITHKDKLGLGEAVENIDHSLTFSSRRCRQETIKK